MYRFYWIVFYYVTASCCVGGQRRTNCNFKKSVFAHLNVIDVIEWKASRGGGGVKSESRLCREKCLLYI